MKRRTNHQPSHGPVYLPGYTDCSDALFRVHLLHSPQISDLTPCPHSNPTSSGACTTQIRLPLRRRSGLLYVISSLFRQYKVRLLAYKIVVEDDPLPVPLFHLISPYALPHTGSIPIMRGVRSRLRLRRSNRTSDNCGASPRQTLERLL